MPSVEAIKQFVLGVVMPPVIAAVATWVVVHVPLLSTFFHLTAGQVGNELAQTVTFGVAWVLTWATQHHILAGHYSPSAKAAAGPPQPSA